MASQRVSGLMEECPVTIGDELIIFDETWENCIRLMKINKEINDLYIIPKVSYID